MSADAKIPGDLFGEAAARYQFAAELFKRPFQIESTTGCFLITPEGRRSWGLFRDSSLVTRAAEASP